jgi:hypothetical protein
MADPITKKIDTLPAMTDTVANNDKLLMLDVTASAVDMTKLITMSQIPISLPTQLAPNVVENAAIDDDAVQTTKIKDYNVTIAKLAKSTGPFVMGRSNATATQAIEEIKPTLANTVLLGSATTTSYGKVTVNHIDSIAARTVIGNATDAAAAPTAIAAGTDGYVLRRSGDTIGFGTITNAGLASGAVTAGKIATGGISASGQFATQVVDTAALKNGNVTLGKMAANSVDSDQYVDGSIDEVHLANGIVSQVKLGAIKRTVLVPLFGWDDLVVSRTFTNVMRWAFTLNGHTVTNVRAAVATPGSATGAITVEVKNNGTSMKTLSIGSGAVASSTYSVTSVNSVVTDNPVTVVVTYGGTTAKGLTLYLEVTG